MNLILRNCDSEGRSRNDFQWNLTIGGITEAPDWKPTKECGNGLHGFLWGEGDSRLTTWPDALWLVCEIGDYIDLKDKVKFQRATTLFVGSLQEAAKFMYDESFKLGIVDKKIIGLSGDYLIAGDRANLRGEGQRIQTAGHYSAQTAGNESTQTAGGFSAQTAGGYSSQTAGHDSIQKAGYNSTQTAGYYSTQTAEHYSTQTAEHYSAQTAGNNSNHKIGNKCYVTTGVGSVVIHRWFEGEWKVKTFVIDAKKAGKKFFYKDGKQKLV